jgi:hypothetical protein
VVGQCQAMAVRLRPWRPHACDAWEISGARERWHGTCGAGHGSLACKVTGRGQGESPLAIFVSLLPALFFGWAKQGKASGRWVTMVGPARQ